MTGPTEFQCGFALGPVKFGSFVVLGSCELAKSGIAEDSVKPPAAAPAARNQDRREIISVCSEFFLRMQPPADQHSLGNVARCQHILVVRRSRRIFSTRKLLHHARRTALPTVHPAPRSSTSKSAPRRRSRSLQAIPATPRGASCPLPRARQNTPAPSAH